MPTFASKPASISLLAGVAASKSLLRPTNVKGIIEKFFPAMAEHHPISIFR
jgi:hypothetical protein